MKRVALGLFGATAAVGAIGGGLALFSALITRRVEAALPPQGRFADIDGNRIHYLEVGSGPTVVMVHGLGGQMANFTYSLVDELKDRYRLIVVERPGAGYSDRAKGASARLSVQADVLAGFIDKLGLKRPLLVGHSLGGALALATALQHPEAVGGLALLSPLTQPMDAVPLAFRGLAIPSPLARRMIAWTLATPLAMLNGRTILREVFGPEPPPADYATRGGGLLGLRPRAFYATSTDLMAVGEDLPGFADRYPSLKLPVGILFGTRDRLVDHQMHGRPKIDGLIYEQIEGAGHMIPVTQPKTVAAFIDRMAAQMVEAR